jgi:hypothetical protein
MARATLGHASIQTSERYLRADKRQSARTVAAVLSQLSAPPPRRVGRRRAVA